MGCLGRIGLYVVLGGAVSGLGGFDPAVTLVGAIAGGVAWGIWRRVVGLAETGAAGRVDA
jgi:hypothetical protein